jgi:chemotaxis protein CheD
MNLIEVEPPVVYVDAGEIHLCRTPTILRTVLGSCVAVTFWSGRLAFGAMCHAALPKRPAHWPNDQDAPDAYRYVDVCIRYLVEQFSALGIKKRDIAVKLFGGGDVLPIPRSNRGLETVGRKNCLVALQTLEEQGYRPAAADLGGLRGRVISFHTGTGEVMVRRLPGAQVEAMERVAIQAAVTIGHNEATPKNPRADRR